MAIKFVDIKDDETPAKKPKAVKSADMPSADAEPALPAEPIVDGGLPFGETANPPKPKRRGRPGSGGASGGGSGNAA